MGRKSGPVMVSHKGKSWSVKQDGETLSTHRTQGAANTAGRREMGLIRFRGHVPKGGYDGHDGSRHRQEPAVPAAVQ